MVIVVSSLSSSYSSSYSSSTPKSIISRMKSSMSMSALFLKVKTHLWSKRKDREPVVPMLPLNLLKIERTSATVRVVLSVSVSTNTATPWGPYPSYVTLLYSLWSLPMAFLIARSMLSFGMFSRLHTAITERSVGLFSGSGPPAFTAMAICLPRRVKVLAMWPHLFIFAALRYSNARPILLFYI